MAEAAQTLDLTEVLKLLNEFRVIAEITQCEGAAAHQRMLDTVARLQRGEAVPTIPGHVHEAVIAARMGD